MRLRTEVQGSEEGETSWKAIFAFFWCHIRPYRWAYVFMLFAPLLSCFSPFVQNYATKLFVDRLIQESATYHCVVLPLAVLLINSLVLELMWRIRDALKWRSEPYVRTSILIDVYDRVQHHPYVFFQKHMTGSIVSKIKGIGDEYKRVWSAISFGVFRDTVKSLISLSSLFFINYRVGIFVWAFVLVFAPLLFQLSRRVKRLSYDEADSLYTLVGRVSDNLTNVISLFAFASRGRERDWLQKQASEGFIPCQVRLCKYESRMKFVSGLCLGIVLPFGLLFYMLHLRMQNLISVGDFAFVFGICYGLTIDLWHMAFSWPEFIENVGQLRSALQVLPTKAKKKYRPSVRPLHVQQGKIQFQDVCFAYPEDAISYMDVQESPVFRNLNLIIHSGAKVGLVGHSGAGKSSLIHLLLGYSYCDSGKILLDGQDISQVCPDLLREQISLIPQETQLFHRTIFENIAYGRPHASKEEVMRASGQAHIHDYIMSLPQQYETSVGEKGLRLSGGQRQRIAIARAILKDAPILILDEATSSLDSETEGLIQASIAHLMDARGKTTLAIAHRLSTLKHMDWLIVLDKGHIVDQGTHEELMSRRNGLYRKLWDLQKI